MTATLRYFLYCRTCRGTRAHEIKALQHRTQALFAALTLGLWLPGWLVLTPARPTAEVQGVRNQAGPAQNQGVGYEDPAEEPGSGARAPERRSVETKPRGFPPKTPTTPLLFAFRRTLPSRRTWRGGRVAEGTGLLNRYRV